MDKLKKKKDSSMDYKFCEYPFMENSKSHITTEIGMKLAPPIPGILNHFT